MSTIRSISPSTGGRILRSTWDGAAGEPGGVDQRTGVGQELRAAWVLGPVERDRLLIAQSGRLQACAF